MSSDVLLEEFEVLESIYPTELTKLSEREILIQIEPEDPQEEDPLRLALNVQYTDGYPDELPDFHLEVVEGSLDDKETDDLLDELKTVGQENLGMAMTFTIVSHLRDQLLLLVNSREEHRKHEEAEKERLIIEAEEARTRGTPITEETFKVWKAAFDQQIALKRAKEDEEKMKGLSSKEREEYKKIATRLSGRQLFECDKNLAISDANLEEEGAVSVDVSQYDRTERQEEEEEEEEETITFSDSD